MNTELITPTPTPRKKSFVETIVLTIILCAIVFFLTTGIGCATTGGNSQQTMQNVSLVLNTAANAAAIIAIKDNPDNRKHVELAVTILDNLLVGGTYEPGAVVSALQPVIKELRKPEINLAVNTALNLYNALYGSRVKDKIGGNANAKLLLTALRDGVKMAAQTGNVNNPSGVEPPK